MSIHLNRRGFVTAAAAGLAASALPSTVGVAAVAGGALGGVVLADVYWGRASTTAILTGAISASVLGAFLGFLAITWWEVASKAWREAVREHHAASQPKPKRV